MSQTSTPHPYRSFFASSMAMATAVVLCSAGACRAECPADLSGDGFVNAEDLSMLLGAWGAPAAQGGADVNGDGLVNAQDLGVLLAAWGSCPNSQWYTVLEQLPNPMVVTNAALREAIVASGHPWRVRDNATQIEMVLIPQGSFTMGCSSYQCALDEHPSHSVTLNRAFYIGRYEVTQAQWQARMGSNPSFFQGNPAHPVEQVSWNMILGPGGFLSGTGLRLPTEAEWEYSCDGSSFPTEGWLQQVAWYSMNSDGQTHPVGEKLGNKFGLHDMSGNVSEWVTDRYAANYYASSPSTNPMGAEDGSYRVLRGGCFAYPPELQRDTIRFWSHPASTGFEATNGFRVARTADPALASEIGFLSPNTGSSGGGTPIRITGLNLEGTTGVLIGGVAASAVTVVNSTTVTAVTPAGTIGSKDVVLTRSGGNAVLASGFTFLAQLVWATVLEESPDPEVVTSAALRNAIIATGYPWRVRDNGTNIEMVLIPPGTFDMGCSASNGWDCFPSEGPVHAVTLTNAFYLGRYEVTQAEWTAKMGSNPSYFQPPTTESADTNRPVEQVPLTAIESFMAATGMRLPTEAEWERAYRAGTTTAYHGWAGDWVGSRDGTNDDNLVGNIAWYSGNNGAWGTPTYGTKAVGQKSANGFGLHDMSGNVWEIVNDWWNLAYYSFSPSTNPLGPESGEHPVIRGGSWGNEANWVRSSIRAYSPGTLDIAIGFRVARSVS